MQAARPRHLDEAANGARGGRNDRANRPAALVNRGDAALQALHRVEILRERRLAAIVFAPQTTREGAIIGLFREHPLIQEDVQGRRPRRRRCEGGEQALSRHALAGDEVELRRECADARVGFSLAQRPPVEGERKSLARQSRCPIRTLRDLRHDALRRTETVAGRGRTPGPAALIGHRSCGLS
jgi:hypothetical protein